MMTKHIKILIVFFLILICVALLISWPLQNKPAMQSLLPFARDQVAGFEVSEFTEGLAFKKIDDTWMVRRKKTDLAKQIEQINKDHAPDHVGVTTSEDTEYKPADVVKVVNLLTTLGLAEITNPIASDAASLPKFQINGNSLRVVFFDKNARELGRVSIGKAGPDMMSTFVRRDNAVDVYVVNENLRGLATTNYEEWMASPETEK